VLEHGEEQGVKRLSQSLAKSRSNTKDLIGLGIAATTAHAEGFIQTYTEHRIGGFKTTYATQISLRLFTLERKAPIFRH
jgi:uncharacterized membrane protein YecN with MAPEG domain